jgi:flagellar biosynthesis/type III secretory pathway protein FliH
LIHRMRIELGAAPSAVQLRQGSADAFVRARQAAGLDALRAAEREEGARAALEGPALLLEQAAQDLVDALEEARGECARQAVELALGIARQIVGSELAAGQHDIERVVRETLARSGVGRGACVVHLHPSDLERLRHVVFRAGTRLEADEDVGRGSVHVTTPKGLLVHDVEACLDAVAERLRGELR